MGKDNNTVIPSLLPFRWGDIKAISKQTGIPYLTVRNWRTKPVHEPTEENNRILEAALQLLDTRKKDYEKAATITEQYIGMKA
jgi:hypothetical protein